MLRQRFGILHVLALWTLACDSAPPASSDGAWWHIDGQPAPFAAAGDLVFGALFTVIAPSAEWIVAADGQARVVHVFSAEGMLRRSLGRSGGGPAEFADLQIVVPLTRDSVAVHDTWLQRVSVISSTGDFVRSIQVPLPRGAYLRGVLNDSLLVFFGTGSTTNRGGGGFYWDSGAVALVGANGARLEAVNTLPATLYYGGDNAPPVFLAPHPHLVARGSLYCYTSGESARIECFDATHVRVSTVTWDEKPRPLTREVRESYVNYYLAHWRQSGRAPMAFLQERMNDVVWPDDLPVTGGLLLDSESRLWVQEYRLPYDTVPTIWRVFSPDGDFLAKISLPREYTLTSVSGTVAWGIWKDELDVQSVRAYRIRM